MSFVKYITVFLLFMLLWVSSSCTQVSEYPDSSKTSAGIVLDTTSCSSSSIATTLDTTSISTYTFYLTDPWLVVRALQPATNKVGVETSIVYIISVPETVILDEDLDYGEIIPVDEDDVDYDTTSEPYYSDDSSYGSDWDYDEYVDDIVTIEVEPDFLYDD